MAALRRSQRLVVPLVFAIAAAAYACGTLAPFQTWLSDQRFRVGERSATGQILLVDIDAKSLAEIGVWPWPRTVHADLVDRLQDGGAKSIAFDVDFSSRSQEANDAAFAAALDRAGGSVFLAAFSQRLTQYGAAETASNLPIPLFASRAWLAHVNVVSDRHGVVRRVDLSRKVGEQTIPAMALMLAAITADLGRTISIDYSIDPASMPRVSAVDLLEGRVPSDVVSGRNIIVGAAALELRDVFQVPVHGLLSGPSIQALAAETLLQARAIEPAALHWVLAALAVAGLLCMLAWQRLSWISIMCVLAAGAVAAETASASLQVVSPVSFDTSPLHLAFVLMAVATVMREIYQRRVLLAGSRDQVRNTRAILDRVVADNFAGVLVIDETRRVRAMSRRASEILGCPDITGSAMSATGAKPLCDIVENAFIRAQSGVDVGAISGEIEHGSAPAKRLLHYALTFSRLTDQALRGADRLVACLTFQDVTEERHAQERLNFLASYDALTGLRNRHSFGESLTAALAGLEGQVAVLFFDLDRFKTINDTLGHVIGDALLRAVGERANALLAQRGQVSRFGGDEFAAWVEVRNVGEAEALGRALIDLMAKPHLLNGHHIMVGASVGCAVGGRGDSPDTLIRNADTALYRAKTSGGNQIVVFDNRMDADLRARQAMEIDLWRAFEDWQFELVYQPQVSIPTGKLTGVEVLLRWHHPQHGYVSPADFIPVAEAVGLISQVGRRVLLDACTEVAKWPGELRVSVNVSPSQFLRGDLVADVQNALEHSGLPADRLELEITESLFIHDADQIEHTMREICAAGVTFAIDDFGTGYSSLSYIRRFPVRKIKIDRAFISGLPLEQESVAIVSAVVALANSLGLAVNAEGVETKEQADALRLLGCDEGQGWLFGRPEKAGELMGLIRSAA